MRITRVPYLVLIQSPFIVSIIGFADRKKQNKQKERKLRCCHLCAHRYKCNVPVNQEKILTYKSKFSPLNKILAQLALCLAALFAKLIDSARAPLKLNIRIIRYYSDSYLNTFARTQFHIFVASRIAQRNEFDSHWFQKQRVEKSTGILLCPVTPSILWFHGLQQLS